VLIIKGEDLNGDYQLLRIAAVRAVDFNDQIRCLLGETLFC